jgi:hypothetical protein
MPNNNFTLPFGRFHFLEGYKVTKCNPNVCQKNERYKEREAKNMKIKRLK